MIFYQSSMKVAAYGGSEMAVAAVWASWLVELAALAYEAFQQVGMMKPHEHPGQMAMNSMAKSPLREETNRTTRKTTWMR